jgi:hypothetical protein
MLAIGIRSAAPCDRSREKLLSKYVSAHEQNDPIRTNDPEFEFPDTRQPNDDVRSFLQIMFETNPCPHCGAVQIAGGFTRYCNGYSEVMRNHLPQEMRTDLRLEIERRTNGTSSNFPRIFNKDLRPVIENANIRSLRAGSSTIFTTGIPYARDSYRQFLTYIDPVFNALDRNPATVRGPTDIFTRRIVSQNETLKEYIHDHVRKVVTEMQISVPGSTDQGMNLAILNSDGIQEHLTEGVAL